MALRLSELVMECRDPLRLADSVLADPEGNVFCVLDTPLEP